MMDGYSLQAEGPDAFSQFHLYVCSAFLVRWSEKLREMDFQVRRNFSLAYRIHFSRLPHLSNIPRASLCSCSHCRRKIGRTTKSRCSSVRRMCLIRSGTTRRATLRESEIENVFPFSAQQALPTFCASFCQSQVAQKSHQGGVASAINLRNAQQHHARGSTGERE